MQNQKIKFDVVQIPPINTNSCVVSSGQKCVIFDAWGTLDAWRTYLDKNKLKPVAIYSTHGHPDHISAAPDLSVKYNIPWYLSVHDFDLIGWGNDILDWYGIPHLRRDTLPRAMNIDATEILPDVYMQVIETPGHTRGGVMFYFPKFDFLIAGDTIFRNGVGRCDLLGGDMEQLHRSVSKIYGMDFPDRTFVVSGHGENSTIAILKSENPYFMGM